MHDSIIDSGSLQSKDWRKQAITLKMPPPRVLSVIAILRQLIAPRRATPDEGLTADRIGRIIPVLNPSGPSLGCCQKSAFSNLPPMENHMRMSTIHRIAIVFSAVLLSASEALGKTVQVGICLPNLQTYPTISQAVTAVVPGSTILVCPGTYREQVTISQPVTLRGVQSGNAANPVIKVPSGGLTKSVIAPANGIVMFFQVLVQGTESGLVNISNIAVDGSSSLNQFLAGWVSGIYFQNSSGTVSHVATYHQRGNGYGFGVFLEGTTAPAKTILVQGSSVHDFDAEGIRTNGSVVPNLTVQIKSNSVISSNSFSGKAVYGGIDVQGAMGSITGNLVITHPAPPLVSAGVGVAFPSNTVVSGNTVVNWGIWALGNFNTVKSNMVSLPGGAITISGNNNTVQYNRILNTAGGSGISFNCTGTANTVTQNLINDSYWGILDDHGGNIITPNVFSNVTNAVSPPC
jgi:hypothetical protein